MDKYESSLKIDQMKSLFANENFEAAADVADTINWNKIKNVNSLVKAAEVYSKVERYEDCESVLLLASDRSPGGRLIIYKLAEVYIKLGDFEEAEEYYNDFVEIAPHDNLRYVIKYNIRKSQGAPYEETIPILEELCEQEYTEEWAYELAYLYHKSGQTEKCIDACDEIILWFGDGPYVERALELKMLYQPLTKIQEDKYRRFRMDRDGKILVTGEEMQKAGEPVRESVVIPKIDIDPEKFNTINLQAEIAKGMQQIMEATEKETVSDTMDNIKKIVEEIPYLQLPRDDSEKPDTDFIETDEEINDSLKANFAEMLREESDGQISLFFNDRNKVERQITGQLSIEEILGEWENTKRVAEMALQEAEQRKLESAKARALVEAENLLERLNDIIPKLEAGITPKELLAEEYMQGVEIPEVIEVAEEVPVEEELLTEEETLVEEEVPVEEEALVEEEVPVEEEIQIEEELPVEEEVPVEKEIEIPIEAEIPVPVIDIPVVPIVPETIIDMTEIVDDAIPDLDIQIEEFAAEHIESDALKEIEYSDEDLEEIVKDALEEVEAEPEVVDAALEDLVETEPEDAEEVAPAEEEPSTEVPAATIVLPEIEVPEDVEVSDEVDTIGATKVITPILSFEIPEEEQPENEEEPQEDTPDEVTEIRQLSDEQKAIFSYFVPVKGMEDQLCKVLTNLSAKLKNKTVAGTGNLIVQGGSGCGKTVLATSIIRVLQLNGGILSGKVGKIDASGLNNKNVAELLEKVAGGCLIIESAGDIDEKTAEELGQLMTKDTNGTMIVLEDTSKGIKRALSKNEAFAKQFSNKVKVPIFTNDELVAFARAYANELDYEIDEMAILALYTRISNIQRLDQATTLTEVKEIVDEAIEREARSGLKKFMSILTAKRYTDDDKIVLSEKHFEKN